MEIVNFFTLNTYTYLVLCENIHSYVPNKSSDMNRTSFAIFNFNLNFERFNISLLKCILGLRHAKKVKENMTATGTENIYYKIRNFKSIVINMSFAVTAPATTHLP